MHEEEVEGEILTSREYGVATIWLVATLGSRSTLKKVTRKAILDVNVTKACETIEKPEAPLALRLQSNLLYGVARVYSQQCQYVLTDAEATSNSMRSMFKLMHTDKSIVPEASHKAKPSALLLPDDPNFFANFDLVGNLDPTLLGLDDGMPLRADSQRSTLSPRRSVPPPIDGDTASIGGLEIQIPASASSFRGTHFGGSYGGSAGVNYGPDSHTGVRRQPPTLLDDLFSVGPDGELVDVQHEQTSQPPARREGTEVESGISSLVRRDHEHLPQKGKVDNLEEDDNYVAPVLDDEELPDVDVLPQPNYEDTTRLEDHENPQPDNDGDQQIARAGDAQTTGERRSITSETGEATARRAHVAKTTAIDSECEVRNNTLRGWQENYVANMLEAIRKNETKESLIQAKKNAAHWVLGLGSSYQAFTVSDQGPLHIFSSEKIFEILRLHKVDAGWKRPREEASEEDEAQSSGRSKRLRTEKPEQEQGRGMDEEVEFAPMGDEDGFHSNIEQGREAPTPLEDRHHSSLMPWNQSGSLRPTNLFSAGVHPSSSAGGNAMPGASRRGSRLVSASPLHDRGQPFLSDDYVDNSLPEPPSFDDPHMLMADIHADKDFERYVPATTVDTQTAAQSQWVRSVLEGESKKFLGFVEVAIEEADEARAKAAPGDEEDENAMGSIEFEDLLRPKQNTQIVAAQAFLHVLTLGSKRLLRVVQRDDEAFGPIKLRVLRVQD